MGDLVIVVLAGFFAAMVDGALGMGFGPTSSSVCSAPASARAPSRRRSTSPRSSPASWRALPIGGSATSIGASSPSWRSRGPWARSSAPPCWPTSTATRYGRTWPCSWPSSACASWCASRADHHPPGRLSRRRRSEQTKGASAAGAVGGVTNGLIGAWGPSSRPTCSTGASRPATSSVASTRPRSPSPWSRPAACWRCSAVTSCAGTSSPPCSSAVSPPPRSPPTSCASFPPRILGLAVAGLLLFTQSRELATTSRPAGNRWLGYALVVVAVVLAGLRRASPSAGVDRRRRTVRRGGRGGLTCRSRPGSTTPVRALIEIARQPDRPTTSRRDRRPPAHPAPLPRGGAHPARQGRPGDRSSRCRGRLHADPTGGASTVADAARCVDGPLTLVASQRPERVVYTGASAGLEELWVGLRAAVRSVLEAVTIADLAAGPSPRTSRRWSRTPTPGSPRDALVNAPRSLVKHRVVLPWSDFASPSLSSPRSAPIVSCARPRIWRR